MSRRVPIGPDKAMPPGSGPQPWRPWQCTTHRGILQRETAHGTDPLSRGKQTTSWLAATVSVYQAVAFQPWGKGGCNHLTVCLSARGLHSGLSGRARPGEWNLILLLCSTTRTCESGHHGFVLHIDIVTSPCLTHLKAEACNQSSTPPGDLTHSLGAMSASISAGSRHGFPHPPPQTHHYCTVHINSQVRPCAFCLGMQSLPCTHLSAMTK